MRNQKVVGTGIDGLVDRKQELVYLTEESKEIQPLSQSHRSLIQSLKQSSSTELHLESRLRNLYLESQFTLTKSSFIEEFYLNSYSFIPKRSHIVSC